LIWRVVVYTGFLVLPLFVIAVPRNSPEYIEDITERVQEAIRGNDTTSLASGLLELAEYYKDHGDRTQALEYYSDAVNYFEQLSDHKGMSRSYLGMGSVYSLNAEYRKAIRVLEEAEELAGMVADSNLLGSVYLLSADVYQQMGKDDKALPLYTRACSIARNNNFKEMHIAALNGLSVLENKRGDYLSSLVYYKESKSLSDSLGVSEPVFLQKAPVVKKENADQSHLLTLEKEYLAQKYKIARHRIYVYASIGIILLILGMASVLFYIWQMQHRKITARLTLQNLRQQMNPHFLFNVMNSVYLHLLNDNRDESMEYLSRLTKVLRKTLENSRLDMNLLSEEISLLELYLGLEQKRLHRIKWNVEVDPNIDIRRITIPSMLIQPYVENSVIHGISHLEGDGEIRISFRMNGGTIHCEIEDNGIGRNKSLEINKLDRKDHHSLGTGITTARLNLLNMLYKKPVKVVYSDLHDQMNQLIGTRVLLDIPFEIKEPELN
jgi:tetratricopeptide (TPR) repeat protein